MKMYQLVILACACTWSVGVHAQWQWLDKDGRKVFSDLAPPPEILQGSILKQPGGQRTPASAPSPAQTAQTPEPPAAPLAASKAAAAGTDKELQQRKAQIEAKAEAEDAARKKIEDTKNAARRADNCSRAQRAKTTFESGRPVRQTNDKGELVWLDEAGRTAELRRLQSIIASDCGPKP